MQVASHSVWLTPVTTIHEGPECEALASVPGSRLRPAIDALSGRPHLSSIILRDLARKGRSYVACNAGGTWRSNGRRGGFVIRTTMTETQHNYDAGFTVRLPILNYGA